MKRGLQRRIAEDYEPHLPTASGWKRVGSEFMRRGGPWVQVLGFNASRFDDRYVPRSSMQFLWLDGAPTASVLVQELQTPKGVQRWITPTEHQDRRDELFGAMREQFKPRIDAPLDEADVQRLLEANSTYWPHAFALALTAAERGEHDRAELHLAAIHERANETANEHIRQRARHLQDLLSDRNPLQLRERLRRVEMETLRQLKLEDKA